MNLTILEIAILGLMLIIVGSLYELKADMKRLNKKLDAISKQVDVPDSLTDELKELLADGKKIEAIKKYRLVTGTGLREAKTYVDTLQL